MPPGANVAVTAFAGALKVTLQVAIPVQAPDQPEKTLGGFVFSLSVTTVFGVNIAVQPVADPVVQLIPAGLLITVPAPVPDALTVNELPEVNATPTFSAAVIVKAHVAVPVQAPLQPPKK